MELNELLEVEKWYARNCDGSWEHQWGIRIETIDNPGWQVEIDLHNTLLFRCVFDDLNIERADTNWLRCKVVDGKFIGFGGAMNLNEIIRIFLTWSNKFQH